MKNNLIIPEFVVTYLYRYFVKGLRPDNFLYAIINNDDCEWNAVVQITETSETIKRAPIPLISR
jgi:hypothetical protein